MLTSTLAFLLTTRIVKDCMLNDYHANFAWAIPACLAASEMGILVVAGEVVSFDEAHGCVRRFIGGLSKNVVLECKLKVL